MALLEALSVRELVRAGRRLYAAQQRRAAVDVEQGEQHDDRDEQSPTDDTAPRRHHTH